MSQNTAAPCFITVMSFNMKRNYLSFGKNCWEKRAALVAQVIRQSHPDILGTQELTTASLGDLERLLPEYRVVGQGRGGGTFGEFSAVFFLRERFRLVSDQTFWLSATPERPSRGWLALFPRICTTCRLVLAENPAITLQVYNTHLDHISYLARVNGLKLIIRQIFENELLYGKTPVVLMGDFNATPASKTLRSLELRLTEVYPLENSYNQLLQNGSSPIGRSYHGFHGAVDGNPIDYIFTSKDIVPRAVSIQRDRVDSAFPSDHYPVVAQLELTPGGLVAPDQAPT